MDRRRRRARTLNPIRATIGLTLALAATGALASDAPTSIRAMAWLAPGADLVVALGLDVGVTHAEFIRSQADGKYYFLEVAARVGGVGIDLLVEHATGVNPWAEWARVEVARLRGEPYTLPPLRQDAAGLIVSLARQQFPDTSAYNDDEIVWQLRKEHHVGMVVASPVHSRVQHLINDYAQRIAVDFGASAPPLDHAPERRE